MIYPDETTVLIHFLISKGIIKDIEEWDDFYRDFMKKFTSKSETMR